MNIQSLDAVKSSALFVMLLQVLVSVFSPELRLQNFLCIFLAVCRMSFLLLIPTTFLSLCFVKFCYLSVSLQTLP